MARRKSSKSSQKRICPRCGKLGWLTRRKIRGRTYYIMIHYEDGVRRHCYLGPEVYAYVTRLHEKEGLVLRGLLDENRALEYLDALINFVEHSEVHPEVARLMSAKLKELARKLDAISARQSPEM